MIQQANKDAQTSEINIQILKDSQRWGLDSSFISKHIHTYRLYSKVIFTMGCPHVSEAKIQSHKTFDIILTKINHQL